MTPVTVGIVITGYRDNLQEFLDNKVVVVAEVQVADVPGAVSTEDAAIRVADFFREQEGTKVRRTGSKVRVEVKRV